MVFLEVDVLKLSGKNIIKDTFRAFHRLALHENHSYQSLTEIHILIIELSRGIIVTFQNLFHPSYSLMALLGIFILNMR